MSESKPEKETKQGDKSVKGSFFPPTGVIFICLLFGAGVFAMINWYEQIVDAVPGIAPFYYFLVVVQGLLIFFVLVGWFLFGFRAPFRKRLICVGTLFGVIALFLALFEPKQNDGDVARMVMGRWKFRFTKDAYEKLDIPVTTVSDSALEIEPNDMREFGQFLGPKRDGSYDKAIVRNMLYFDYDWKTNPPEEVWRKDVGKGWGGFSATNGYAITMEQRADKEATVCYDIFTGEIIWTNTSDVFLTTMMGGIGPRSTPTIDGTRVFTVGGTGIFKCIDLTTGKTIWEKELRKEFTSAPDDELKYVMWGRSGSPVVAGDLVIVQGGGPKEGKFVSLVAYNKESGDEVWRAGESQMSYSSPFVTTIHEKPMVVVQSESAVEGFDLKTGEKKWSYERPGNSTQDANCSQPLMLAGHRMLVTKGYGLGAELIEFVGGGRELTVRKLWKNKRLQTKFTSAVQYENYAYGLSNGILECVNIQNGERMWRKGRYGHGQILRIDSELLIISETGQLSLVKCTPDKFIQFTSIDALKGICWNTICVYGEYVLIRSDEEAVCYKMPMRYPSEAKLLDVGYHGATKDPNARGGRGRGGAPGGGGAGKGKGKGNGKGKN